MTLAPFGCIGQIRTSPDPQRRQSEELPPSLEDRLAERAAAEIELAVEQAMEADERRRAVYGHTPETPAPDDQLQVGRPPRLCPAGEAADTQPCNVRELTPELDDVPGPTAEEDKVRKFLSPPPRWPT